MEYKEFILEKYKAINKPISIQINENKFFCIIGENECGKSTILEGINAFDYHNDTTNKRNHLTDVGNLYNVADTTVAEITAVINIQDSKSLISEFANTDESNEVHDEFQKLNIDTLHITRNLDVTMESYYTIQELEFLSEHEQNIVAKKIIKELPRIIYFDDFTTPLPDKIYLENSEFEIWINLIDLLIQNISTDTKLTIKNLLNKNISDNIRKSICAEISKRLNIAITQKWKDLRLSEKGFEGTKFKIEVFFYKEDNSLEFKLIETINGKDDRYFNIKQRSKGFYWFFNFVMRTEFNFRSSFGSDTGAIFLFDEPGAYLHVSMQHILRKKLQLLSNDNIVIYCTHSSGLIDHATIDNTWICYRDMMDNGNILLQVAKEFYGIKEVKESMKQKILEPLINTSIIYDVYRLTRNNEKEWFSKTIQILKNMGNSILTETGEVLTTIAAKFMAEIAKVK